MKKTKLQNNDKKPSGMNLDLSLKLIGTFVALAGLGFGVYQYINYGRREAQSELRKQRRNLYEKATGITSQFAVADTQARAEELARQFWSMYNGELGIVEDARVKLAMQRFGGALRRWEKANSPGSDFTRPDDFVFQETPTSPREKFANLSYQLAVACGEELAAP
jgi:hypothetical protein